ncbi:MAG: 50S ribosomal protein L15 [Ignavibacteria bacterium]|jgi:large subunit ribosomal protein L15|nr:50S ribosomal protein L15 [Ignavibacteria bacterium]
MKHIGNLSYAPGSKKKNKRIGRGPGSGYGGTSTKGHKGQQSRSGYKTKVGFEGGQMPLYRRLPKFGFKNRFRKEYQIINLSRLEELNQDGIFIDGNVNSEILYNNGVIRDLKKPTKILGNGDLTAKLNVSANSFSQSAKEKIELAGGTITLYE